MNANPRFESWASTVCARRARHIVVYGVLLLESDWGVMNDIVLW
jgi:hypothetical protein